MCQGRGTLHPQVHYSMNMHQRNVAKFESKQKGYKTAKIYTYHFGREGTNYITKCDWSEYNHLCYTYGPPLSMLEAAVLQQVANMIKKKAAMKRKIALMKMGRNSIVNQYLLRKVFIPRFETFGLN
jgi:hypothetical protein